MTGTLNDFIAKVKSGMAKQTHFTVALTLPSALSNMGGIKENMDKVILFCDQAQLPGISFSTNQVRSYGEFKEVPYEKLFEPVTLSFYVDRDMIVKRLFDEWMGLVQSPSTRDFRWPNQYITNKIDVIVMDTENRNRYVVSLYNAYPKAVSPIQLDYASKDVMKLQVTLTYQYTECTQLGAPTGVNSGDLTLTSQMPAYNYGYGSLTEIPANYFNNFAGFQQDAFDFSFTGAKSYASLENIGELTGFGGIFS